MSLINDRAEEFTGAGSHESIRPLGAIDRGGSGDTADQSHDLARAQRWLNGNNGKAIERRTLLSLAMGQLASVSIPDVSLVLGLSDKSVVSMLHGKESMTPRLEERLNLIVQIFSNLHHVLKPTATAKWLHTSIPALSGKTPLEALRGGQVNAVLDASRAYLDPSYK